MHFLIAIVLLLSLCWDRVFPASNSGNGLLTVAAVFLSAMLVPMFAWAQTWILKRRYLSGKKAGFKAKVHRMAAAHSFVWAVTSIAVIVWLRWPDVVQQIPYAKQIPLVDELLLVAPAMVSLIASWAIFIFGLPKSSLAKQSTHADLFLFWMRMQMTFVTAPILLAFFVADCVLLTDVVSLATDWQPAIWMAVGIVAVVAALFYPKLMLLFWPTKKVQDADLLARVAKLCRWSGMKTRQLLIWRTGNSIVNAAAVGTFPGTEVILVSDMLLEKFDADEVDAVVLHELGHVKHHHSIKRTAWIMLPLLMLGLDESLGLGLHRAASDWGPLLQHSPAICYLAYLLIVLRTVFRSMEFQADRFAIETLAKHSSSRSVELTLEKMAVIYPKTRNRQTGLHPSIRQRLSYASKVRWEIARDDFELAGSAVLLEEGT